MAIVKKDKVTKEINNEGLLSDYLLAGWEIVKEDKLKKDKKEEVKENKDILK